MADKPELIIFSQNLLGGGASFHKNMIANFPRDIFTIKCIYLNPTNWHGAKALDAKLGSNDVIFSYGEESEIKIAKRLELFIPNTPGVIVANLEIELICLDLFRKPKKTVFFICHDAGFIPLTTKFESIIDVYIAHNVAVCDEIIKLLPHRLNDIYFIQHGVNIYDCTKSVNIKHPLNVVFLARHHAFKGIYDLPVINDLLIKLDIYVKWMVLGDGPERNNLMSLVENNPSFQFAIPQTQLELIEVLKMQDVFILPSRNDGLPVALLESMSVGCVPIIANFSDGIKKVVTDDIGFVVPIGDNELFAEKIKILSENRQLLTQLSFNCMKKVKDDFDIKKQALLYHDLYKRYKDLRKNHSITISDLFRRLSYNSSFNKLIYLLKGFKHRMIKSS